MKSIKDILNSLLSKVFLANYFSKVTILFYYFIALVTLLGISWYIYLRFIQERLARPIPFLLTEFWFYLIIFLCLNYLYAIKATLKPVVPNQMITSLLSYLTYLALPLIILDRLIKTNKYSYPSAIKSVEFIAPPGGGKGQRMLLVILHLIPRVILVIIFILDVFWFNKLNYFYYYLFLSLFPLLYNYHKFTMYQVKELAIQYLESFYYKDYVEILEVGWDDYLQKYEYEYDHNGELRDISPENTWEPHPRNKFHLDIVDIRKYIQIILEKDIDEVENEYEDYFELYPDPLAEMFILDEYKKVNNKEDLTRKDYDHLNKTFLEIMPKITRLNLLLHYLPNNEKRPYITRINLLIYLSYIIGWGYILFQSIHSLGDLPITFKILEFMLENIKDINPFINP